ncbi:MAG: hypothetical protein Q9218_001974 [Villophora microphyllina]
MPVPVPMSSIRLALLGIGARLSFPPKVTSVNLCIMSNRYLQTLLPLLASGLSFGFLAAQSIQRTVKIKRKHGYQPLKLANGTADLAEEQRDTPEEDDRGLTLHPTKSRTNDSIIEIDRPWGENVLIVVELLALVAELAINVSALVFHSWGPQGTIAGLAGLVSWGYILTLAVLRLFRINARIPHISKLWNHTAVLYGINWLATALLFRSALVHPRSRQAQALTVINFLLVTVLALIAFTSRKGNKAVVLEYEDGIEPSREPLASVLSLATFSWVDAIIWHGFRNTYELSAVWNLVPRDKAAAILADYAQLKKTSGLAWHLMKHFKRELFIQAAWAVLSGFFTFVPTIILKAFLEFVEDPETTPVNAAWFYIILLALSSCFEAVANGQALWIGRKICIRLRAVIVGEIYAKALRRKAAAGTDTVLGAKKSGTDSKPPPTKGLLARLKFFGRRQESKAAQQKVTTPSKADSDSQVNVGTIINLMAVDSFKVADVCAYLHFLWGTTPVQLVMCILLLYRVLGYSSFVSIAFMILVTPLNLFIAKQFSKTQEKIMAATDARIHTTNEVLQNIRIIKYFAWEIRFGQIVDEKRRTELAALRNRYILWTAAAAVWFGVPLLITFFSFMIYTLVEKKPLVPSIAFTALSLFSILRIPLDQLADMIAHVQECQVSVDRVEEFLNEDETEKYSQLSNNGKTKTGDLLIGFENATLTWGSKDTKNDSDTQAFRMIDLSVRFSIGNLNLVVGPTGAGKTSLLMALLGEMTLVQGSVYLPGGRSKETLLEDPETGLTESVAYCAQQAWLMNDTIKQNILFASPLDESRYKAVIAACALGRDLEILDAGDQTLVGEKGIALSGGQKQRISLARALYCNSKHILLDDCLSAVDSHTAKHIFEQCIRGPLMVSRTCILVTHNTALCLPAADHVVHLKNGRITAQGSPEEVIAAGALGLDQATSKPSSKTGTGAQSRVPSMENLDDKASKPMNGHAKSVDDKTNGSARKDSIKQEQNANIRTEAKAAGGVKKEVLKLYLTAMGSWYYWTFAIVVFLAQQLGSVVCNVWISKWANSYQIRNAVALDTTNVTRRNEYILGAPKSSSLACLSGGTCSWNLPLLPQSAEVGMASWSSSADDDVNVSYYLGIYAILALLYIFISMLREVLIFWGSLIASSKLHERLLESVTRAKFKFFDSTPLGQIMNRFSKDVEAIDQEVAPIAVGVVGCLTSVLTIVVLISVITPGFLIAGLLITVIYFAIGYLYIRSSVDLKRLESVQKSPLYQQFGETLSGMTTIRAYGHEMRFIRDNLTRVDTHNRPFIYLWAANRWLAFRVDITGALVSFFAGVFIILRIKTIDAGAAGLSMTYAVMFSENILWLVRLYSINEQNMNSVERVKEYMDVEQEAEPIKPDARPPGGWPTQGAIEFDSYSTSYRSDLEPVLNNVTFSVQPGERVGIVGRTGAGKSSLALALFRGLEAEKGKIVIDGVDIGLIGLQDLREAITIVPQDPTLFTGTMRSNLDPFGLFTDEEIFSTLRKVQLIGASPDTNTKPTASEVPRVSDEGNDHNLTLTQTFTNSRENANIFEKLSSSVAESGSNLSQGQRQLLCLARALLKAPKVLLMDEATASIDYATDSKIQETLREVKGSTIITIAHRLQTIVDYDKVLVLEKGKVMEYDAPWELIEREGGIFKGMCEMSGDLEILTEEAKKAGDKRKLIDFMPRLDYSVALEYIHGSLRSSIDMIVFRVRQRSLRFLPSLRKAVSRPKCRFASSSAPQTAIPGSPASSGLAGITTQLDQIAPRIDIRPDQIDVLEEPKEFYGTLKRLIGSAKKRIFLSTLYVGKTEYELVSAIHEALTREPELRVSILADGLRGIREYPEACCASLLASLVTDFPDRVEIRMYHTPNLTGLRKSIIPKRINEGWGLQHIKLYGVDDQILLSGANLSSDYFTNRQDRYHLFSSKRVTEFYYRIHQAVCSISFLLEAGTTSSSSYAFAWPFSNVAPNPLFHPRRYIEAATTLLLPLCSPSASTSPLQPAVLSATAKEADTSGTTTIVYPLLSHPPTINTELPVLRTLLSPSPSTNIIAYTFTAGYFNPHPLVKRTLLALSSSPSSIPGTILTASPYANGFYNSAGVSGLLPAAYTHLSLRFLQAARRARANIGLKEWKRGTVGEEGGWTYHAKGVWAYFNLAPTSTQLQQSSLAEKQETVEAAATLIGSSNYTTRSYNLDLEVGALVVTNDKALIKNWKGEEEKLKAWTQEVGEGDLGTKERKADWKISKPKSTDLLSAVSSRPLRIKVLTPNSDHSLLKKYDLKPNDAILAEEKHMPLYSDLLSRTHHLIAGGAAQNTARGAQYLLPPNSVLYIGCVGRDEYADQLRSACSKAGLRVEYRVDETQPTGKCGVLINGSDRSLCTHLAAANEYKLEHLKSPEIWPLVQKAKVYYVGGFHLTVCPPAIMALAEESAAHEEKIFIMNLSAPFIPQFFKKQLDETSAYWDYLIGNETEALAWAEAEGGEVKGKGVKEIARFMAGLPKKVEGRKRVVVITQGTDPTVVAVQGEKEAREFPVHAIEKEKVFDTNGAGDAFAGGFVAGIVEGKSLEESIDMGKWLAKLSIQELGPQFPFPKQTYSKA